MALNDNLLTVLVTSDRDFTSGDLPSIKAIASQVAHTPLVELSLGGTVLEERCKDALRQLTDEGKICTFIDAGWTMSRGAIERALTVSVKTPYILLVDRNTTILDGALARVVDFIERCSPIQIAGFPPEEGGSLDTRCVLVNTALLRNTGTYQVPLPSHASGPTELLQQHAAKNRIPLSIWAEDIQQGFALGAPPSSYTILSAGDVVGLTNKLVTVCVCAYGDSPDMLSRCLTSLCNEPRFAETSALIVGCNAVSEEGIKAIHSVQKRGIPVTLVRSATNLNKSGMRRIMVTLVDSKYIASCDDDIFLKPGWLRRTCDFLTNEPSPGPDAAGCTLFSKYHRLQDTRIDREVPYVMYAARRKWWRWNKPKGSTHIPFPGGGFHIMKTDFIRQHDYPDSRMFIDFDDILLGDLMVQVPGVYAPFPPLLKEHVIVDLNPSRGERGQG